MLVFFELTWFWLERSREMFALASSTRQTQDLASLAFFDKKQEMKSLKHDGEARNRRKKNCRLIFRQEIR